MGLFDDNTQLTDDERNQLEKDIENAKGVYRVYPRNAEPGESHWSDGSVSTQMGDDYTYGCSGPESGLIPVRTGPRTVSYMSPEQKRDWERRNNSTSWIRGFLSGIFE